MGKEDELERDDSFESDELGSDEPENEQEHADHGTDQYPRPNILEHGYSIFELKWFIIAFHFELDSLDVVLVVGLFVVDVKFGIGVFQGHIKTEHYLNYLLVIDLDQLQICYADLVVGEKG